MEEPGRNSLSRGGGDGKETKDTNQLRRPLTGFMSRRLQGMTSVVLLYQIVRVYVLGGFPCVVG